MATHVVQRTDPIVAAADDDDPMVPDGDRDVAPPLGHIGGVRHEDPFPVPDPFEVEPMDVGIDVALTRKRVARSAIAQQPFRLGGAAAPGVDPRVDHPAIILGVLRFRLGRMSPPRCADCPMRQRQSVPSRSVHCRPAAPARNCRGVTPNASLKYFVNWLWS